MVWGTRGKDESNFSITVARSSLTEGLEVEKRGGDACKFGTIREVSTDAFGSGPTWLTYPPVASNLLS